MRLPFPALAARRRTARRASMVAVSRAAVIVTGIAFVLLVSWSAASVWYLAVHDEIALSLLERQAAQKQLYEDKLAALRTKLDEVSSQRLVEQEVLEGQLKTLLARQSTFESRQAQLETLAERTGSVEAKATPRPVEASGSGLGSLLPDIFQLRLRPKEPERQSRFDHLKGSLDRAASTLAVLEAEQLRRVEIVAAQAEARGQTIQGAIRRVGLDPAAFEPSAGLGGPLVPAHQLGAFEAGLQRAQASLARFHHLRRSATALPFAEPINGEIDLSSGFGVRMDPFTRGPAMHTGLDFRAEYGAAVRAAGAGRVITAEYSGAYGNMVEVEHPGGVTSRYAHLSSMSVTVGQEVKAGAVLGRVGSTGRSTGPHLHYETRVNGDAVDPQRFLKAGAAINALVGGRS